MAQHFSIAALAALVGASTSGCIVGSSWEITAEGMRGQDGEQFTFDCDPGGHAEAVWGTNVYTDDSSVCTAAVHAGLITFAEGGSVVIEILPGQSGYCGTDRYGVTTRSYGAWSGSFFFPSSTHTGNDCGGTSTCLDGQVAARLDGVDYCLDRCTSHADCGTCCGRLGDGTLACAPSSGYCEGGGCDPGTAPMYPGGPCVEPPSSCPEGWAVCDCPEYHGVWCHPDCDAYRRGEGGPGTYCGGTPC